MVVLDFIRIYPLGCVDVIFDGNEFYTIEVKC